MLYTSKLLCFNTRKTSGFFVSAILAKNELIVQGVKTVSSKKITTAKHLEMAITGNLGIIILI